MLWKIEKIGSRTILSEDTEPKKIPHVCFPCFSAKLQFITF